MPMANAPSQARVTNAKMGGHGSRRKMRHNDLRSIGGARIHFYFISNIGRRAIGCCAGRHQGGCHGVKITSMASGTGK